MNSFPLCAGLDIGSLSTNVVIIGPQGIMGYSIVPTGSYIHRAVQSGLELALKHAAMNRSDISAIVATGYGRLNLPFPARQVTEITCHGRGATCLFPKTRTVIDLGGQDSKVIALDERGRVADFVMNDKCAAGTGRFLEVMAGALETRLEELGQLSLQARKQVSISSMCTVFAESEVVSLIAQGANREDIIGGLHDSIASRIFRMAKRLPIEKEITFTGGVAKNVGMIQALRNRFKAPINLPDEPQIVGALGAALIARNSLQLNPPDLTRIIHEA
jgi:predicted CoA-substrate-specific enzyme activase